MAPYGNSVATELEVLLKETKMDCDNYAILVSHLFRLGPFNAEGELELHFVGWDGGAIGNHAQIFATNTKANRGVLLDPTVAVVALADFNSVASGKSVRGSRIVDFSSRADIKEFRAKIIKAVSSGLYRPSDLLYYFDNMVDFESPKIAPYYWMTPGAMALRERARRNGTESAIKDPRFARSRKN